MNLQQYSELALRTCQLKGRQFELEHAAYGMMTEAGELVDCFKKESIYGRDIDIVNVKEEVGDGMWYANLALATLGLDWKLRAPQPLWDDDHEPTSFELSTVACVTAAAFGVCVTHPEDARGATKNLAFYIALLRLVADRYGFTLEDAAEINIAKLAKRYPEGTFSAERALNRDLDGERAVLEGKEAA
jgi:NTP pyrophosphatase (non-canonical NTP hydrolase)